LEEKVKQHSKYKSLKEKKAEGRKSEKILKGYVQYWIIASPKKF
jgi:hypothetical protein